ncbi:hypothetical protein P5W98_30645 [Paraburkholderia sp. A1BS-2L]|uniref:hypothetical protein n=1 Tax=unclassified Paraburkholderia TaxID=2615204 RepID=UPI003B826E9D
MLKPVEDIFLRGWINSRLQIDLASEAMEENCRSARRMGGESVAAPLAQGGLNPHLPEALSPKHGTGATIRHDPAGARRYNPGFAFPPGALPARRAPHGNASQ